MKKNYSLPDFIIVGAAKCGTTSIAKYLSEHSQVYIPEVKECRFFSGMKPDLKGPGDYVVNQEMITSIEAYSKEFEKGGDKVLCDASVDYLYYYENTVANIKKYYPKDQLPKIIISLRNPVKRTFSMYSHLRRDLREELNLEAAIAAQEERENANWEWVWQYTKASLYHPQVKYFLENYEPSKIKIIIYEEFVKDTNAGMKEIFDFIGLPHENIDTSRVFNASGEAKNKLLQKAIVNKGPVVAAVKKLIPQGLKDYFVSKNLKKTSITEEQVSFLKPFFVDDVLKMESLLGKKLDSWK